VVVYLLCWVLDVQGMREAGKRENNAAELIHSADGRLNTVMGMGLPGPGYGIIGFWTGGALIGKANLS